MFAELDPSTHTSPVLLLASRAGKKGSTWSGNTKSVMCGQRQRWSYKKRLKKVKTKKNLKDRCLVSPTGNKWRCVTRSLQRRQQYGTDAIHFSLEVFRQ